tara:strand:+ start:3617 stop:4813 length:1197 start_codon:yes stop_codon:yes gene_type:complete
MNKNTLSLFLEINEVNFIFFVGSEDEQSNFKIAYKLVLPLIGISDNRVSDLGKSLNEIKKNIYIIEKKFNYTFKEITLILENFNPTFISLSGFKKLNGSQILRENITYIINNLKSFVNKVHSEKTILHIFNSKFLLDKKKIENLPIGLFGDFYAHELSFSLIDENIFKNLKHIFDSCNLKVKKLFLKSFLKGAYLSNYNNKADTFCQININNANSKILYFENNALKFEQDFKFGSDIIIKDISKITSLKTEFIKNFLIKNELNQNLADDDLVEEEYFDEGTFRKIKKKLIYQIALARIKEISELILFKNINVNYYNKSLKFLFLEMKSNYQLKGLREIYKTIFSLDGSLNLEFLEDFSSEKMLITANQIVHFGWKKEAIPVAHSNKSLIARLFDALFD